MDNTAMNQNTSYQQDVQKLLTSMALVAFPANQPRVYDNNIRKWVESLVDQKYRPTKYITDYRMYSAQNPSLYPPLTQEQENMIMKNLPDIPDIVAEFEISRVYNKLEIEVYQFAVSQLPAEKVQELNNIVQSTINDNPNMDFNNPASQQLIERIRALIFTYVPNMDQLMETYKQGVINQYMAGRF